MAAACSELRNRDRLSNLRMERCLVAQPREKSRAQAADMDIARRQRRAGRPRPAYDFSLVRYAADAFELFGHGNIGLSRSPGRPRLRKRGAPPFPRLAGTHARLACRRL